jgi:hypothetical protein
VKACLKLAGQHRIMTQFVMVFLAERKREDALSTNVFIMLDQCRIAGIHKAPGQVADQPDRPVCQPSRSAPESAVSVPPSKSSHHDALFNNSKIKPLCATFCLHRELHRSTDQDK